uniref:Uncharacterized protein n=1 Tax=Clandestinovirus TaxID=2831644 RepID=A0A8F8KL01_9VIRU|nr:hypothetical protein KOM_12_344 [Clandestinovirus]
MSARLRIKPLKKKSKAIVQRDVQPSLNETQQLTAALKKAIKQALEGDQQITPIEVMSIIDKALHFVLRWAVVRSLNDAKPLIEQALSTVLDELKNENILKPEIADTISSAAGIALNTVDLDIIEDMVEKGCKSCCLPK